MKSSPFSRSIAMMAAISAAIASGMATNIAIEKVGPYVSRGKGRGIYSGKKRSHSSGKYTGVFNGKRECDRRVRQMARHSD